MKECNILKGLCVPRSSLAPEYREEDRSKRLRRLKETDRWKAMGIRGQKNSGTLV